MITPVEINNKEFKKSFRGYDMDEVDDFLDQVADDYEKSFKQNLALKEKVQTLKERLEHYSQIEETLQNTMILAQNAADQAKESAQKEADLILRNANDSAKKIMDKAHDEVLKMNDEYYKTKEEFIMFTTKFRNFMNSQMEMFESLEKDFVKNYNVTSTNEETNPLEDSFKEIEEVNKETGVIIEEREEINKENTFTEDEFKDIKSFFVKED